MQIKVTGESPFQILSSNFTIGPSESGYDLMFSADGLEYSKLFTVGANTNRQVTQVAAGSYYFLSGNTDTVTVNWMKDCGGGSGGGSYVLPVASENTLGGVKIGSGLTMSGDTLNANPGGYTLPMASDAVLGGVKIGSGITVDSAGTISVEVQSGGAQEAKTIVLSTLSPEDFSEDDIDAMQEMVDYLAEFPVDNLPAARIFVGSSYYTLSFVDYASEDTENQTPEERYFYKFNYVGVWGDEGMDESQNTTIQTFFLNAENVEESYNMYWDSSENKTEKLSAVEDPNELDARVGDVAAKNKSVVFTIHIDWSNLPFSEDMDVLEVGNLTLHAWDNDGTDTLTVSNGEDSYDFVDDGDNALLQYTDNLHWSVLYENGDVRINLVDSSSKLYFDEALITLNDCDAQYDGKVIPDGLYQYDEDEGEWKPIISAGSGISIEDGAISVNIGDGLAFSGNTLVVSGGTSSNTRVVMLNKLTQQERLDLYNELASLYDYQNSGWSSAYTEDMFAFFLDLRSLADQQAANVQDAFEGFFPMQCVRMHPTDYGGAAFFTGVEGNRTGNGWLINIRYIIAYDGSVDGPSSWDNGPVQLPENVFVSFTSAGTAVNVDAYLFARACGPDNNSSMYAIGSNGITIVDANNTDTGIGNGNIIATRPLTNADYADLGFGFKVVFEFMVGDHLYRCIGDIVYGGQDEGWHLGSVTQII